MEEELKVEDEQSETIVEDSIPSTVLKHPLQNTWTLWYFESDKMKTWEENQRKIVSFNTVEDFWSVHHHIKLASELRHGCDYSLFKRDIRPMWEDCANKQGGRWLLSLDKKQRTADLDRYWLEVILFMIGEEFETYSEEICGAVVNIRNKGDKIGLWTGDAYRKSSVLEIGRKLKERLELPKNVLIEYQSHRDTSSKAGPSPKFMC